MVKKFLHMLCAFLLCTAFSSGNSLDPSLLYFQVYSFNREGQKLEKLKKYDEAFEQYSKSRAIIETIQASFPKWKKQIIEKSYTRTKGYMEKVQRLQVKEQSALNSLVYEPKVKPDPLSKENAKESKQQVQEITQKIEALKQELSTSKEKLTQETSVKSIFEKENEQLREQLSQLQKEKSVLLQRPLQREVDSLNSKLENLSEEKNYLRKTLTGNKEKYKEAVAKLSILNAEIKVANESLQTVQARLEQERVAATEIITTMQLEQKGLKTILADKEKELKAEKLETEELQLILEQSEVQIDEIEGDYSALQLQYDQLTAILKSDDQAYLKEFVQEKVEQGKKLQAALTEIDRLKVENSDSEQELIEAKKALAIAKTQIIRLRHELELKEVRVDKLVQTLSEMQNELEVAQLANDSEYSSEEVVMLKGVIQRQLEAQQRRQFSQNVIEDEVERLGVSDPNLKDALELANTQEIELTDAERRLLAQTDIDGEFRFSDRVSEKQRVAAGEELSEQIDLYTRMGKKAFENQRYAVAEEIFTEVLEEHPGHIPSMLNVGVINYKQREYSEAMQAFENAIAMKGQDPLPFAHLLIGATHYELGEDDAAQLSFFTSLEQNPANPEANLYLGIMAGEEGALGDAIHFFQKASELSPTLAEPHFNMARVYFTQKQYEQALTQYQLALKKGTDPDREFEKALEKALPQPEENAPLVAPTSPEPVLVKPTKPKVPLKPAVPAKPTAPVE